MTLQDAKAIMEKAAYRLAENGPQIFYNGEWMDLARTDLVNDVCTDIPRSYVKAINGKPTPITRSETEWIDDYKKALKYGVRLTDKTFAVIDRFSDG